MKDGDLLLPRVQITSDDRHEGGLRPESVVTVPQPEPTSLAAGGRPHGISEMVNIS